MMPASVPTSAEFDSLSQRVASDGAILDDHTADISDQGAAIAALTARVAALETATPPGPTAPPAPTGLAAALNHTARVVTLAWNPVTDADGYRVLLDGTQVSAVVTATTIVTDPLTYGPHTFAVAARRAGVWSAYSASITGTLVDPGTPPAGQVIWKTTFDDFHDLLGYEPRDSGYFQQVGGTIAQIDESGNKLGRFTIAGGGSRAEAIGARTVGATDFHEGDDLWFSSRIRLGAGYPTGANWQLIQQWKQGAGTGSPPIELDAEDGVWRLAGGESDPRGYRGFRIDLGASVPGQWENWLFHIKFSSDPAIGTIDCWRNGAQLITNSKGAQRNNAGTMYPGTHIYPKMGYYRNTAITQQAFVDWDRYAIGTTRAAAEAA